MRLFRSIFSRRDNVHRRVARNDLAGIKPLLARHPELVHDRDRHGRAPLHVAAAHGRAEAAHMLIEAGADVNAVTPAGDTPLHLACELAVASVLLRHGAVPDVHNQEGLTPILNATAAGYDDVVALLRQAGAEDFLILPPLALDEDDPFMLEAQGRARRSIGTLLQLFPANPVRSRAKVPFVTDAGETEHIWCSLLSIKGEMARVRLRSYPRTQSQVMSLTQDVTLAELEDWLVELPDGTIRGGYSFQVMFRALREHHGELPPEMAAQEKRYVDMN